MVYTSLEFFVLFLLTWTAFALLPSQRLRFLVITAASLIFYAWAGLFDFCIFLFVVVASYSAAVLSNRFPYAGNCGSEQESPSWSLIWCSGNTFPGSHEVLAATSNFSSRWDQLLHLPGNRIPDRPGSRRRADDELSRVPAFQIVFLATHCRSYRSRQAAGSPAEGSQTPQLR